MSLILVLLTACSSSSTTDNAPTWHQDVEPLVSAHCASCHTAGGAGGFDLTDPETAQSMSEAIRIAVVERTMPPWFADSTCNDYQYDTSLSEEEIETFASWADAGAPMGADDASPKEVDAPDIRVLSRIDHVLTMAAPYQPTTTPDEYRCFVLDWPYEEDMYVTGFSLDPDNINVVHHGIAFILDPELATEALALDEAEEGDGYECFGGPRVTNAEDVGWLGAWAPGGAAGDMPEGTGILVEAGSKIVLQVHFNVEDDGPAPAQVAMQVMVEEEVERPAGIQPWANPAWLVGDSMSIPPNTEGQVHDFSYRLSQAFDMHYASLHMHQRGVSARLWKTDPEGTETCLLEIPRWDFDWQRSYLFQEIEHISPGDSLTVECTWDNPTDETITWGDNTTDEMCLATMYITLP